MNLADNVLNYQESHAFEDTVVYLLHNQMVLDEEVLMSKGKKYVSLWTLVDGSALRLCNENFYSIDII